MAVTPEPRLAPFVLGRAGPALIAHGAGNTARLARAAIEAGADLLEVDLWVHGDRLEARHERAMYPLPFLFEKWYLRIAPRRPFGLTELLTENDGRAGIFLDLKNGGERAAELIRRSVEMNAPGIRIAASAQQWAILRAISRVCPAVETFYSIDVPAKLDLFLSISERDVHPAGVSCRHELLTAPIVDRLHQRGLLVVAWTVDEVDRAAALAAWGVDGITTHRVAAIREALGITG
jgi:glycerophosphoryl diester phosphodiesterase